MSYTTSYPGGSSLTITSDYVNTNLNTSAIGILGNYTESITIGNDNNAITILGGGGEGGISANPNGQNGEHAIFIETGITVNNLFNLGCLAGGGGGGGGYISSVCPFVNGGSGGNGGGGGGSGGFGVVPGGNGGGFSTDVYKLDGSYGSTGGGGGFAGNGGNGVGNYFNSEGGTTSDTGLCIGGSSFINGASNGTGNGGGGGGGSVILTKLSIGGGGGAGGGAGSNGYLAITYGYATNSLSGSGGGSGGGKGGIAGGQINVGEGTIISYAGGDGGYGIYNLGNITTLENSQNALQPNASSQYFGPLYYYGTNPPTYYNIIILSETNYGQLYFPFGTTNTLMFGISTISINSSSYLSTFTENTILYNVLGNITLSSGTKLAGTYIYQNTDVSIKLNWALVLTTYPYTDVNGTITNYYGYDMYLYLPFTTGYTFNFNNTGTYVELSEFFLINISNQSTITTTYISSSGKDLGTIFSYYPTPLLPSSSFTKTGFVCESILINGTIYYNCDLGQIFIPLDN